MSWIYSFVCSLLVHCLLSVWSLSLLCLCLCFCLFSLDYLCLSSLVFILLISLSTLLEVTCLSALFIYSPITPSWWPIHPMSTMVEIYCLSAPFLTVIISLYYDSTNPLNLATHLTHVLPAVHLLLHGSLHHFPEPYLITLESLLGSCELGMSAPNRIPRLMTASVNVDSFARVGTFFHQNFTHVMRFML